MAGNACLLHALAPLAKAHSCWAPLQQCFDCTTGCNADPQAATRRLSAAASKLHTILVQRLRGAINTRGPTVQALLARACTNCPPNLPPALLHCSQRLRDIINKGLTNEELLRGVKTAWDKGWRQIKL